MRKILLFCLVIYSFLSVAQNTGAIKAYVPKIAEIQYFDGSEFLPFKPLNPTVAPYPAKLSLSQTLIGQTYYDLQTNSSTDDRIFRHGNNELSATWTMGMDYGNFPDRGTGYNYYNGNQWQNLSTIRVEPVRTGWPTIAVTSSGKEHLYAHTVFNDSSVYSHRPVAGTGSWTHEYFPGVNDSLFTFWPRMAVGGMNNNSLHLIVITVPTLNNPNGNGAKHYGIDGAMIYSRSQDEGVTWDKVHELLPGIDSSIYSAMGADAYAIHARGNTVAIVAGSFLNDWSLWKSTDNGDTWVKTVIHQFPFPAYDYAGAGTITDLDGDSVADIIPTTDGKVAILIDHNNTVHVWAGAMMVIDDNPAAGGLYSYFPYNDALIYWNENFGAGTPPDTIATTLDLDGDGVITFATDSIPFYRGGMTTQPSAGIDPAGNIYVAYQSVVENTSSGSDPPGTLNDFNYRNVYIIASTDGGASWKDPKNISADEGTEAVYPVLPKNIGPDCVDIIWQQDNRPDIATVPAGGNSLHPFIQSNINQIIHDCVPTQILIGINEPVKKVSDILVYPNPATEHVKVNYTIKEPTEMKIEFRNTLGQVLMIQNYKAIAPGLHSLDMDVSSLPAGIYFINTIAGGQNISAKLIIQ